MPSKRYNIWFDLTLIERIKLTSKRLGVKISTYVRMAVLEKLGRDEK